MCWGVDCLEEGLAMHALMKCLFPICRSVTGNGVRKTFEILQDYIPINIIEVPSGTKVFDWVIPDEWNVRDAYIKDSQGHRIVDFQRSNIHVLGYSVPFQGRLTLDELKPHLYSLPEYPDDIPYATCCYSRGWGFCLSNRQLESLKSGMYEVRIDSQLSRGSMTLAELIIPGRVDKEILLSTNVCHPSMSNDALSGLVVTTYLARDLLAGEKPYYTYRVLFLPETIGAITYLSMHGDELKEKVVAGYVINSVGDNKHFSYLKTRRGDAMVDRLSEHVLRQSGFEFKIYDYISSRSDERQYCSPGIDLPVGSLMRSMYGEYPKYHTSADNLEFVTPEALADSFCVYSQCVHALEVNRCYIVVNPCEPDMGRRGLYAPTSILDSADNVQEMLNVMAYCDGDNDLLKIAERLNLPIKKVYYIADQLTKYNLLIPNDTLIKRGNGLFGVGIDIESVSRFKGVDENFKKHIFTESELGYCLQKSDSSLHLAARFAGKEAVIKSLAVFGVEGLALNQIEILNDHIGAPLVSLFGEFKAKYDIQISLSHTIEYATATAIAVEKKFNDKGNAIAL